MNPGGILTKTNYIYSSTVSRGCCLYVGLLSRGGGELQLNNSILHSGSPIVTKHWNGRKPAPNFRMTWACLASSFAAGDSDTCLGRDQLVESRRPVRACVQMDGPLRMRAFIPRRRGRGQGSKPELNGLAAPRLGTYQDPEWRAALAGCIMQFVQLKQQPGWQGCAGALCCLCFASPVPGWCSLQNVAVQLAWATHRHTAESGEVF